MDIQEKETLIAEIERFKEEAMKSYVVSCWAESYTNTDPFGYVILENENNKVWWLKTQAYQLWEMWQAAKAQDDQKIKILLCDDHLKKCESPTGIFNSQYPDEEPCLICLAKQAKAQAVPEWIEYEKQSPRIDGRYQIFINGEQLAADWESPYGFSSAEDGTAFIQELITHWSVLNNDPVVKAQEQSHV